MASHLIDQCTQPLIGLHYISEYWICDLVSYWCDVCETSCGSDVNVVINHVIGRKHRTNYMNQNYASYLEVIMSRPSGERDLLLLEYSRVIEAAEGRQKMKVKKEAEMNDNANKASSNSAESPDEIMKEVNDTSNGKSSEIHFETSMIGSIVNRIAIRAGTKCIGELLRSLPDNLVTNEDEASKALEAANILTKALLEYRLNSSPKDTNAES